MVSGWPGERVGWDADAYVERVRTGPCFVCRLVRGDPAQPEVVLHRDRLAVTFLSRPGVVPGHTLVAPVRHAEAVVGDFRSRSTCSSSGGCTRSARPWPPSYRPSGCTC